MEPLCDCGALLATDHDTFDYELIRQHVAPIVDTHGRYPHIADKVIPA